MRGFGIKFQSVKVKRSKNEGEKGWGVWGWQEGRGKGTLPATQAPGKGEQVTDST